MLAALAAGTIENNEIAVTKPTNVNRAIVTLLMKNPGLGREVQPRLRHLERNLPAD
jgi:hypothetical protein